MQKIIINNSNRITAYFSTLYYFEIIYFMFILLILYGKPVSVIAGFTMTILITIHIVQLYFKKNINRKIQLFIMDIHIAYAGAYLINIMKLGFEINVLTLSIIFIRSIIIICEIPLLFILTDERVTCHYNQQESGNISGAKLFF